MSPWNIFIFIWLNSLLVSSGFCYCSFMKIIFLLPPQQNGKTDAARYSEMLLFLLVILRLEKIEFLLDPVYWLHDVELEPRRRRTSVVLARYLRREREWLKRFTTQKYNWNRRKRAEIPARIWCNRSLQLSDMLYQTVSRPQFCNCLRAIIWNRLTNWLTIYVVVSFCIFATIGEIESPNLRTCVDFDFLTGWYHRKVFVKMIKASIQSAKGEKGDSYQVSFTSTRYSEIDFFLQFTLWNASCYLGFFFHVCVF